MAAAGSPAPASQSCAYYGAESVSDCGRSVVLKRKSKGVLASRLSRDKFLPVLHDYYGFMFTAINKFLALRPAPQGKG
jgi:hypothetical protein